MYFWNETLHVWDSSSVHHQEFFTVHTTMVYVIQLASRIRTEFQIDAPISQMYFCNKTLHISDSSSDHHQEFFTVHTAMIYVIQLASRIRTEFQIDAPITQMYFCNKTLHISDSSSVHHQEFFFTVHTAVVYVIELASRIRTEFQIDAQISQMYFWNKTLHISDSSSVHHQEFFTAHTAIVYVIQLARRIKACHKMLHRSSVHKICYMDKRSLK